MIPFSFRQLEYFAKAARHGNVTDAARAMNASQPSISQAIIHLEQVLGQKLFLRQHAKGMTLTPFGRRFLEKTDQLLAQAQDLLHLDTGNTANIAGRVVLGCYRELSPYYLPGLIKSFNRAYPKVEIEIADGDFSELSEMLRFGRVDMALSFDLGLPPGLEMRRLVEIRPYALLAADHPAAEAGAISLEDLATAPLILHDIEYSREFILALFHQQGLKPQVAMKTPSFEMQRSLVANGHGVALCYSKPQNPFSYDGLPLISLDLSPPIACADLILIRNSAFPATGLISLLQDHICRYFHMPNPSPD